MAAKPSTFGMAAGGTRASQLGAGWYTQNDWMGMRTVVSGARLTTMILACGLVLASCAQTDEGTIAATTVPETVPSSDPTPTVAGGPLVTSQRQSCSGPTLAAAAGTSFPGAEVADVVCEQDAATATIANGPNGETLALFGLEGGVWVLRASAPVDGDLASVAPAGFSSTAVPAWERLRSARLQRAANPRGDGGSTGQRSCRKEGDVEICPTTTEAPIATAPADPDDPNAPTTIAPSGFCRFNFNDPQCQADNQFEP